jgi:hypothetical protein
LNLKVEKLYLQLQFKLISVTFLTVFSVLISYKAVQADLPVRPDPGLPVRPTPSLLPNQSKDDEELGAHIVLRVEMWREDLWAVVQWQGTDEAWHEVEGWHGQFNQYGVVRWWVDAKDANKGPFRWVIYETKGSKIMWTSTPFRLPSDGILEFVAEVLELSR